MPFGGFAPLPFRLGGSSLDGLTAAQHARIAADMVAIVKSGVPFAVLQWVQPETVLRSYLSLYSVSINDGPAVTVTGSGDTTFTWDPAYKDAYDNSRPVKINHATATICALPGVTAVAALPVCDITAANVVRVRRFDTGGSLALDTPITLVVS